MNDELQSVWKEALKKSVALQALTNLGRLSSRRWH
jgi:hypothetical protein